MDKKKYAKAAELLENHEEMFPHYQMGSDVNSRFKSSTTHWCVMQIDKLF